MYSERFGLERLARVLSVGNDANRSGTVLDLPYIFKATDDSVGENAPPAMMSANPNFSLEVPCQPTISLL